MADEVSETAFRNAVSRGHWERATSLLLAAGDRNAFVTLRDRGNNTALHEVARAKEPDIRFARLLVENAADKDKYITAQSNTGFTALHHAALSRHSDIASLLIESITDKNGYVTLQNHDEETALHFAAISGCFAIAVILIENATDKNKFVTAQTRIGWTALHKAARAGSSDVALLLIENVADKNKFVTTQDHQGWTALHEAASQKHSFLILKELLRNARDENYINLAYKRDSRTALHQAVLNHPIDTTLFLLQNGAMTTLLDREGNTAWDLACISGSERWEVITDLLLRDAGHGYMGMQGEGWSFIEANDMAGVNQRLWDAAEKSLRDARILARDVDKHSAKSKMFEYILRQVRREFHENQEVSPHLATRESSCIFQALDDHTPIYPTQRDFISLVMPLIFIGNMQSNKDRKAEHTKQTEDLRYCISKDRKFLEYHMPVTLDEYCSPALPEDVLDDRNKDQVLSRYEKSRRTERDPAQTLPKNSDMKSDSGIFDELWTLGRAYVGRHLIDPQTRKTSKKQQPEKIAAESDLRPKNAVLIRQVWIWKIGNSVVATLSDDDVVGLMRAFRSEDKYVGIAIILKHLVELFDTPQSDTTKSLLRIYENVLSAISEDVNEYVKSVLIEDIDVDKEKGFFHQISDFREELSMIKSILAEQEEVWVEFMSSRWPNQRLDQQQGYRQNNEEIKGEISQELPSGVNDEATWRKICRPRVLFNKYRRRITKLEEDAERVERNITTKLDLKQKHAAMREAHSTAIISAAVLGFTIITIIFAPLSFIAALFALPIDEFNKGKMGNDKDGVYSSAYIGRWTVATEFVSISITLLAMWAALRFAGLHVWGKKGVREWIRQSARDIRTAERQMQHESSNANESDGVPTRRTLGDIVRRRRRNIPNPPMAEP
ncbi:hypothetical protein F4860DRAFT_177526 [Xylaria cubensis]|nr:hypothetical protein F4860DRAFT_177526 [Xylaria cubensis]